MDRGDGGNEPANLASSAAAPSVFPARKSNLACNHSAAEVEGAQISVLLDDQAAGIPAVVSFLERHGQRIVHISSNRPNLESIFLSLTGRQLRDP